MTDTALGTAPLAERVRVGIDWTPVVAGTLAAAALAFVLHSFALAVGFSLSSTATTWRDTSSALVFASGLYILLAALASYAFGGYVAARLRVRGLAPATPEHGEFGDGMHGLIVWALATLVAGLMALGALQSVQRLAAPSGGPAATSVAGENIIAYDLDKLFRSDRRPAGDLTYPRAEAARILLTTSSHTGMTQEDRNYLVHLVGTMTGLAPADADRRVLDVASNARLDLQRARHSAVVLGFMTGAAALLGAIVAWWAAAAGGRHRDGVEPVPGWLDWGHPYVHRWDRLNRP